MSMMLRAIAVWGGVTFACAGYLHLQAAPEVQGASESRAQASAPAPSAATTPQSPTPAVAAAVSPERAVLNRYCVTCHNDRVMQAGLALNKMDIDHVSANADVWEKVVRKLRTGMMPPAGSPRPDKATYDRLASSLEDALDRTAVASPNPGQKPAIHRLNRAEYTNAIRDVLALDVDGASLLPADEASYGFDNIAGVLSVSPTLLERYILAARKISQAAVGDPMLRPSLETYRVSTFLLQSERMSEDLPFGSRGGMVARHHFPLDGEYNLRIRLQRSFGTNKLVGLENREKLDIRLDGTRLAQFEVGGECVGKENEPKCYHLPGAILTNFIPSEYELTADEGLNVRFAARAGTQQVSAAFEPRSAARTAGAGAERSPGASSNGGGGGASVMGVDRIEIEGPFNAVGVAATPSRQRIFVCQPKGAADEEPCAKRILLALARRAYRRPVTDADADVGVLVAAYRTARRGGTFEAGVQAALERLLVSPSFLLRIERDPPNVAPGTPYRINDLALASRLSFFLWSSIPDDELTDVAAAGKLREPAVLQQQIQRMLADPRATALVKNFFGQWLFLRHLQAIQPDPELFPDFDDSLREAFRQETELFLESQLREDRSVIDLVTADYTFANERLARFYGLPNVRGSHFRRVSLQGTPRAGLLSQGSLLTVTSYANRTSPVVRGYWMLANLIGAPPPPPPPNVPTLPEVKGEATPLTMRARMERHRTNPVCANCHRLMDPMGFALENFNGIGKWRVSDGGAPLDVTGAFPDGTKFDGPAAFRQVLATNYQGDVARTVTEKLLIYALGRGLEHYDMPAVRKIIREAGAKDHRWSALVQAIVTSTPFQMRTARAAATSAE